MCKWTSHTFKKAAFSRSWWTLIVTDVNTETFVFVLFPGGPLKNKTHTSPLNPGTRWSLSRKVCHMHQRVSQQTCCDSRCHRCQPAYRLHLLSTFCPRAGDSILAGKHRKTRAEKRGTVIKSLMFLWHWSKKSIMACTDQNNTEIGS